MDDLDRLLTPTPVPPASPALRERVFKDGAGVLRRRRWFGVARHVAMLAVVYAAGLATMAALVSRERQRPESGDTKAPVADAPGSPKPKEVEPFRSEPPPALERMAARLDGGKRADYFRRAGDGYLAYGDEIAAVRCYRKALDASPAELAVKADTDTWLMMSLKLTRTEEKKDARN